MQGDISAGETRRYQCEECNREFDVCYEPKAKTDKASAAAIEDAPEPSYCPFCGKKDLSGD